MFIVPSTMTRFLLPPCWIAPQTTTDGLQFSLVGWLQASITLSLCPQRTRVPPSLWYGENLGVIKCSVSWDWCPRLSAPSHIHDDVPYALNSVLGSSPKMTAPGLFVFKRASTLHSQTSNIETHKISRTINQCNRHKFILKSNSIICVLVTIKFHGKTVRWKLSPNFSANVDFQTLKF